MKLDGTAETDVGPDPLGKTVIVPASVPRESGAPTSDPSGDHVGFVEVTPSYYDVKEELARGGMGRVRVARDRRLGRWIALKEILAHDADLVRRFEREARITARLQHPSIVSVYEAGVWPSGQPFYAMPLVKGRSFDQVIASHATLEGRLALIPNVLAVADAIAYAHGERVIHRDLKPGNVLVGGFGETVVIDWGIAKSLDDPSDSLSATRPVHDLETMDGAVIGTPAYMPPEQASGEPVGVRADVYALGAMLAHVLTGLPPYVGESTAAVLAAVRSGPPPAVRTREPDAPPDLVAIVERAMARDPANRYPSARELAEDLRRFQTGQLVGAHRYSFRQLARRWVRRYRTALVVATAALVVLVVGAGFSLAGIMRAREQADTQRELAEASRDESDALTQVMLFKVHDKLAAIGRLDLLDDVARTAASHYAKVDREATDLDIARQRATALANIGDVMLERNELVEARAQYEAAIRLLVGFLVWRPGDREADRALARNYRLLGGVALRERDVVRAKTDYEVAAWLDDQLVTAEPHDAEALHERALTLKALGLVHRGSGELARARREMTEAIAIAEQLVERDPANAEWARDLAEDHAKLGLIVHSQGDVGGAVEHAKAGLAIMQRVANLEPANLRFLDELALSHAALADELQFAGSPTQAVAEFRAALAIFETLVARDPTNPTVKIDLGKAHKAVASALAQLDDLAGGLRELRAALPILEEATQHGQPNAQSLSVLGSVHQLIGTLLTADQKPLLAIPELRAAIAISDRVLALAPADHRAQRTAALVHNDLGEALTPSGDPTAAIAEHRTALAMSEKLLASDPSDAWSRSDLGAAHRGLGNAFRALHQDDEAITELRAALALADAQAAKDTHNLALSQRIFELHEVVADIFADRARKRGADRPAAAVAAIADYEAAIAIARRLAAAWPDRNLGVEVDRLVKELAAVTKQR